MEIKECKVCGKKKPETEFYLVGSRKPGARRGTCKSCSYECSKRSRARLGTEYIRKYHTDYYHRTKAERKVKTMWESAKVRAKKKGLDFTITTEDIVIPECCPILGIPFKLDNSKPFQEDSPSLDRIDNSKGYVKGNVIVVSAKANTIKRDYLVSELDLLVEDTIKIRDYYKDNSG